MMKHYFEMVAIDEIDIGTRNRVHNVNKFVCEELGVSLKPVVWIRPVSKEQVLTRIRDWRNNPDNSGTPQPVWGMPLDEEIKAGYTPKNRLEIWIRSDYSDHPDLEYVVAHEIRHLYQQSKNVHVFEDECEAEGDAYPYGYQVLKRFLDSTGDLTSELKAEIEMKNNKAKNCFLHRWPGGHYGVITNL